MSECVNTLFTFDIRLKSVYSLKIKNLVFNSNEFEPFTLNELNDSIKNLNSKISCDVYDINNQIIKQLPDKFKLIFLKLFNLTITSNSIPNDWKKSQITMIPKKSDEKSNFKNY